MNEKKAKNVKISKAKGRPMLTWVGKHPLTRVKAYAAQHVESFSIETPSPLEENWQDWPDKFDQGGLLFHGDNKDVLAHLLANGFRGEVKLIYIDPPFDSGADYVRKVRLRGAKGTTKVDGEEYTLGEQIQYENIWANDNYLQFMYERLLLSLCHGGLLTTTAVASVLAMTPVHCRELVRKLARDDVVEALVDQRHGQQ